MLLSTSVATRQLFHYHQLLGVLLGAPRNWTFWQYPRFAWVPDSLRISIIGFRVSTALLKSMYNNGRRAGEMPTWEREKAAVGDEQNGGIERADVLIGLTNAPSLRC